MMRSEARHNVLSGFDFGALDDTDFKEDSVREEIIAPILRALGYLATGRYRIIRSKALLHPFVSIGSATKRIYLVPDYLLEVDGRYAWTLEAKAPTEKILNTKHVEQAYSYATHSEVRVPYFALCNGWEFVLYHISKPRPVFHFDMPALPVAWEELTKKLGPSSVLDYDFSLAKDFGLHLKRLGFDEFESLIFPNVPVAFMAKMENDLYSFSTGINLSENDRYAVSFDFDSKVMSQLRGKIPDQAFAILQKPLAEAMQQVTFADALYYLDVDCRVGDKLEENEDEIFLPLRISRILDLEHART